MVTKDIYDELADMLCAENIRIGEGLKTTEFKDILRLQYTPEEARLALQIGFLGGQLDELVGKTGLKKDALKKKLHIMAGKGTVWIDPVTETPVYRALRIEGPGLIETAAWISDKFPWRDELQKKWNSYKWLYVKEGTFVYGPVIPVWGSTLALPSDALPAESIIEEVKKADFRAVANCPCRTFQRSVKTENGCGHLLETCMYFGNTGRWVVENGFGREITIDETIRILQKCEEDGLIHTGLPSHGILCNCCKDACVNMIGMRMGQSHVMVQNSFVAVCDRDECIGCGTCEDRCHVNAISVDEVASVNANLCIGCGVCAVGCDQNAMILERRPTVNK